MNTMETEREDREALERFVVDNDDLERLEALLDQFNVFEAIGAVRQEVRHSDFLAFLLNPQQTHGLGDAFLKLFLQKVLLAHRTADLPLNLVDLDTWSLDETEVRREWSSIDVLMLNEANHLAVVIENKVDSQEHSDQLGRYFAVVRQHYPTWKVVCLFLTPDGQPPSNERFLPVDYTTVAELIESMLERRASTLGADVKMLMSHYAQMLRRHIVSESEIADLCRRIYQKHQRAVELILEHRPQLTDEVFSIMQEFIEQNPDLTLDRRMTSRLAFVPQEWDRVIGKASPPPSGNWSPEGRILLFWVENPPERIRIVLEILPGLDGIRQRLFDMAQAHKPPFATGFKKLYPSYCRIWSKVLVGKDWREKYGVDELREKLSEQWQHFLDHDLPQIQPLVRESMCSDGE